MKKGMLVFFFLVLSFCFCVAVPVSVDAYVITLKWDNPVENVDLVVGCKLYYGNTSGVYNGVIDVGSVTETSLEVDYNTQYYFVVTAYDANGNESVYSNEIYYKADDFRDTDEDGISDWNELASGTDPNDPASYSQDFAIMNLSILSGQVVFPMRFSADDLSDPNGLIYTYVPDGLYGENKFPYCTDSAHCPDVYVESGSFKFKFNTANEGDWVVFAAMTVDGEGNDSFWVNVDNAGWRQLTVPALTQGLVWLRLNELNETGRAHNFHLLPGDHTLEFKGREDGTKLHHVLLTTKMNLALDPVYVQSETISVASFNEIKRPMKIVSRKGRDFILVPNRVLGKNISPDIGADGFASYIIIPTQDVCYLIGADVLANNSGNNSFFTRVVETTSGNVENFSEWGLPVASAWTFQFFPSNLQESLQPYCFESGKEYRMDIVVREDGTKLSDIQLLEIKY